MKSTKEFLAENYANKEQHVIQPGQHWKLYKKVMTHVTTTMTDSIEEFSETHWKAILNNAHSYHREDEKKKKNGGKKKEKMLKRMMSDDIVIVEDLSCKRRHFVARDDLE